MSELPPALAGGHQGLCDLALAKKTGIDIKQKTLSK